MKQRILVVDDEVPIQQLLQFFFRRHGYDVMVAGTANDGLRLLDEVSIQVVILDIMMEDADGLEVLGVIKQAHPKLPVIMLTGMGFDQELENEAYLKGAEGYASKSLPLDQLLMQVHRVLKESGGEGQTHTNNADHEA